LSLANLEIKTLQLNPLLLTWNQKQKDACKEGAMKNKLTKLNETKQANKT